MSKSPKQEHAGANGSDKTGQYSALGVVFASVGLVFMLTMESAAMGIPFLVLGLVFFFRGANFSNKSKGASAPDGERGGDAGQD